MGKLDPTELDARHPNGYPVCQRPYCQHNLGSCYGDPKITVERVADLNDSLLIRAENQRRAIDAARPDKP